MSAIPDQGFPHWGLAVRRSGDSGTAEGEAREHVREAGAQNVRRRFARR